ncbi:MAG: PTS IIA-like nitrogen-regulatory protein PtsN [Gammaproteobacteria bacterium]|nr:PTS IIA-like nitrogen-regulatory protein PtsN [Gammaproteobacteria bacterium]MAY02332.1 PTS IIA-like nitrogen-regulatory protein PtsN [Gammaproteobacteria bacterium]|tara:strand:+ start:1086 stop:1547 length:462 start_codon:yes stop_codon:yes gene_type:complete
MLLESIISPELTFCNVEGGSKKRLLETSAELIAGKVDVDPDEVYEALIAREQLGSTGLGNGIAIPHCRVPKCKKTIGCLIKLASPIDFDAIDQKPVDLLFFLLVPENTIEGHLEVLRTLAELFKNQSYCEGLRRSQTDSDLYTAAMHTPKDEH